MQKKVHKILKHDVTPRVSLAGSLRSLKRHGESHDLVDLSRLFPSVGCHLLRPIALIVRENNPFERAGKTFRSSMDVTRLRQAVRARALREFGVVGRE